MPLALLAVGSYLDREKYEVVIIDGRLEPDLVKAVLAHLDDALYLGVSVLTGRPIRDALRVSRAVKSVASARPDLPVIWGGWHPSLFPRETLAETSVDVAVMAQGEETFGEIVARLSAAERSMEGVAGCAFRRDGEVVINPPRMLRDVNDLPPHDYTLIPVERYFTLKHGKRQLDYIGWNY
jgi:radical SAM superfamily enzyme YgiQ (UPF0313 family)